MRHSIENKDYKDFIREIKNKVKQAQLRAHVKVNTELLRLYWDLAQGIVSKQKQSQWGDGVIEQISSDLKKSFPQVKGFSVTNIRYMKQWFLFWWALEEVEASEKLPQAVGELTYISKHQQPVGELKKSSQAMDEIFQIPWGHNIAIISKVENIKEALFYVRGTTEHGWSRSVLVHQIESGLFKREGKAISNFKNTLPEVLSDLAQATIKDPYNFDFLELTAKHTERELENGLIEHITKFLLELGAGFSYMGRQYHLTVGKDDFCMDLLFYHTKLHCYVVIELKTTKFKPEYAGKLNFYLSAVDDMLCSEGDNPTIGMLICKDRNETVVEYALKDIAKPIGVSEYVIMKSLPKQFKSSLPSIEEIEAEMESGNE